MNKAYRASDFHFSKEHKLLADANFWIFNYSPYCVGESRIAEYSTTLKNILNAKSKLYTNLIIINEVINRLIEDSRKSYINISGEITKKEYRKCSSYTMAHEYLNAIINNILKQCVYCDTTTIDINYAYIIKQQLLYHADINDIIISKICKTHDLMLITDDLDFSNLNVNVLSANPKYNYV